MGQRRLDHLPRVIRLLSRPIPEGGAEAVRHGRDLKRPEQSRQGHVVHPLAAHAREHERVAVVERSRRIEDLQRPRAQRHPVLALRLRPRRRHGPHVVRRVDLGPPCTTYLAGPDPIPTRGVLRRASLPRPRRHQRPIPTLARRGRTSAPHPELRDRSVAEVWAEEKPRLLPLPANPFETDLVRAVRSGKTPYVRFDRNLYSIPHTHVRKPLTLVASATRVRILDGQNELTDHHRTYDTGLTVEDPDHLENLLVATRQANVHTTRDRLRAAVPATATLFERLAQRQEALRPHATRLLALLDDYGPEELAKAVDIALEHDALGAGSITHILETRRRQRGLKPPLRLTLPDRPGLRDLDVQPHDLETYDALGQRNPDDAGQ